MNTIYSYDNVEAMIDSIHSNTELINSMIKKTEENDNQIKRKMYTYAASKRVFTNEQMLNYKAYIENREDIERALDNYAKEVEDIGGIKYISIEICKDNSTYEGIHKIFSKINTLQIKIMEMLCGILGRSNMLLSAI